MAIVFKGWMTNFGAGTTANFTSGQTNFTNNGAAGIVPAAGDVIILGFGTGSTADRTLGISTAGWTKYGTELYANGTGQDTNLALFYRVCTGSEGANFTTVGGSGSSLDGWGIVQMLFSGVDTTTPFDVTPVTATGTGTGRPDPGSITPSTPGAAIVAVMASAAAAGAAHINPGGSYSADADHFKSVNGPDNNDGTVTIALHSENWASGAIDPAAITAGGTTGAGDSWAAFTLALRPSLTHHTMPATDGSYSLTGTDASLIYSSGGYTIGADAGSYSLTGTAAGLLDNKVIAAAAGSYTLTDTAAGLLFNRALSATAGSYSLTGTPAEFLFSQLTVATPGSYGLTGTAANLLRGPAVAAAPGTYSLTGTDATLSKGYTMVAEGYGPNMIPNGDASAGTTGWTNQYSTGTPAGTTTVDAGRFKVTNDQAAGLNYAYPANPYGTLGSKYRFQVDFETNRQPASLLTVMSANYSKVYINRAMEPSLTFSVDETFLHDGTHPSISVFLGLAQTFNTADIAWFDNVQLREVAAYTLTGTDTGLLQGHSMVATPGSYSLTGTPASLLFSRNMVATPGSYSLTGTGAAFTIDTTAYFLTAVPGTYVLTGTNANLLHGWTMPAVTGAYALTGTAVNFAFGRTVAAAPGAYTYTGTSALFGRTYQIAAAAGAYAVVGTVAGLGVGVIMLADPGTYTYTGTDVAFRSYKLAADPGSYTITGWPVSFSLGDLADLVPAPDPIIVFRHQEPEIVRVPKLNALARQAALKVKTVVSMAQLVAIAPNMGLEVHVWDAPGGYAPAYADGFNWRKLSDGTVLV